MNRVFWIKYTCWWLFLVVAVAEHVLGGLGGLATYVLLVVFAIVLAQAMIAEGQRDYALTKLAELRGIAVEDRHRE